jgi:DMSO reductase family type II enzyme chaperone
VAEQPPALIRRARSDTPYPVPVEAKSEEDTRTPRDLATLQNCIDTAVARSFIYRFLAQAFEDPTPEGWQRLCNETTHETLRLAISTLRSTTGILPRQDRLGTFPTFTPDGLSSFTEEYVATFGHAARGLCPMNEIEYGDIKADALFQPHRLADLAAFYRAFGLEITDEAAERHDHICLELEFMSVLAAKEAYALEHQLDDEDLALCPDAQKKFLREHLGRWTPAFTRRLARMAAENSVLHLLAKFACAFIKADCAGFGVTSGSDDLFLRPVDEASESLCASCGITNLPPGALHTTL